LNSSLALVADELWPEIWLAQSLLLQALRGTLTTVLMVTLVTVLITEKLNLRAFILPGPTVPTAREYDVPLVTPSRGPWARGQMAEQYLFFYNASLTAAAGVLVLNDLELVARTACDVINGQCL